MGKGRAREAGDSLFVKVEVIPTCYRTLRALGCFSWLILGFLLRFTPGFMLPPATRVLGSNSSR
jgi:hypothetical protein